MKTFDKIRREISHGGTGPRGWRFAWYEPRRRVAVYYPPPLHWLLRTARELLHRLRTAWSAPPIERTQVFEMERIYRERQRLAEEYSRGYLVGWHECFRDCLEIVEDELMNPSQVLDITALLLDGERQPQSN